MSTESDNIHGIYARKMQTTHNAPFVKISLYSLDGMYTIYYSESHWNNQYSAA